MTASLSASLPEAFFLPTEPGPCFCLFHKPKGARRRGNILYLHPFAEELNTTRHIVAHQARNLAELGYSVLQIDLFGCGDSSGEFQDVRWSTWLLNAHTAHLWLRENSSGPFWIWGLRAGALLAAALATQLQDKTQKPVNLLFWQPVTDGYQMLQQFLRLSQAGEWLGTRTPDQMPASQLLAQGQAVDVAGYTISPEMAQDLSQVHLIPKNFGNGARLVWIEVSKQSSQMLGVASERSLNKWNSSGWQTEAEVVRGISFWQNFNASEAPSLWLATENAMALEPQ